MSENKNVVKIHGCIVCARLFNILVVYAPDGKLGGLYRDQPWRSPCDGCAKTTGCLQYSLSE